MSYYRSVKPKYGNRKTEVDGFYFDSAKEARRYGELKLMQKAGQISDLQMQVPFEVIPGVVSEETGRVMQKPAAYVADFTYRKDGKFIVEDAKGYRTEGYKLKKKLMLWRHGIQIKEV